MLALKNSVQIRIADGGYIITWMEPKLPPSHPRPFPEREKEDGEEKPAYLEEEERKMARRFDRPWVFTNPARCLENKVAVRVDLAAALELVGQILGRLSKLEKDAPAGH